MLFHWLLPERRRESRALNEAIEIADYTTEAEVEADSAVRDRPLSKLIEFAGGDAVVTRILRGERRLAPLPDAVLREGDIVLIEGDHAALDRIVARAGLSVTGGREAPEERQAPIAIEGVVAANSSLIGWSAEGLALFDRFRINLLAVSRRGTRLGEKPSAVRLRLGDVLVLQGSPATLPDVLRDLGVMPLAERPVLLGSFRSGAVPVTDPRRRHRRDGDRHAAGGGRLLRRRGGDAAVPRHPAPRRLCRDGRPDPRHAGDADPGQRLAAPHRRHRRARRLARRRSARRSPPPARSR